MKQDRSCMQLFSFSFLFLFWGFGLGVLIKIFFPNNISLSFMISVWVVGVSYCWWHWQSGIWAYVSATHASSFISFTPTRPGFWFNIQQCTTDDAVKSLCLFLMLHFVVTPKQLPRPTLYLEASARYSNFLVATCQSTTKQFNCIFQSSYSI